jgi:hypothetical protein
VSCRPVSLVLAVGLLVTVADAHAASEPACGAERPWVKIEAAELSPSLATFVSLLRAELGSRGMDLCTASDGAASPVASVRVSSRPDAVTLAVEVRDAVTDKQVSRDVALAGIPPDGRPLTIALAADELLRASWAELALRTAPPPARPVPEAVALTVRESVPPPAASAARTVQLGVGLAWEQYANGLSLYGVDARLGAWIVPRVELALQLGLRSGPSASAANGTVQPSAWSVGASGLVTLTPLESRWGLDAVAMLAVERLTLTPSPTAGSTGSEQSDFAWLAGLGAQGCFRILPALSLGAEVLALLPLRGVDAEDAGARFVGLSGPGWAAQLGVFSAL